MKDKELRRILRSAGVIDRNITLWGDIETVPAVSVRGLLARVADLELELSELRLFLGIEIVNEPPKKYLKRFKR